MASVNKVIIVGNLGRDPDMRTMPSGDAIANIAVATTHKFKDRGTGEQREATEWHRIHFFGRLAEIAGQYLAKGASVYVEGRLQTRKYTDKDGVEKHTTEIIAESMQMLGGRQPGPGQGDRSDNRSSRTNTRHQQPHGAAGSPNASSGHGHKPDAHEWDYDFPFETSYMSDCPQTF